MFYYKKIENNEITEIGTHSLIVPNGAIEITEEEYSSILAKLEEENAPKNPYGISDETYNNIIDDYTSSITSEVASNGYY